ncbi:hypothetical protein [Phenylobacterium aquaticum]|uniref:hypothetical protein n=1 Tax=Phenylobacterium aquaticum TaxID=1763816 RepID=UPI0026EF5CEA|nr:hypothetical protein [Phenylobacterium aquaticum]
MAAFHASIAAAQGFDLIKREPRAVAVWVVISAAAAALLVWAAGQGAAIHMSAIAVNLLVGLAISAGAYRAWLRPEERRLAYLRLGADEQRLLTVSVVTLAPALLVVAPMTRFAPGPPVLAGALVLLAIWAWFALRLFLAGVMSFDQRALRLRAAWSLSRGLVGKLVLSMLLVLVFLVLAAMGLGMVFLIISVLMTVATGQKSLAELGPVANLVNAALQGGLSAIGLTLIAGVAVTAYQAATAPVETV